MSTLHVKNDKGERERERERERETYRQTDRQTERETDRDRDRQTETDRQTDRGPSTSLPVTPTHPYFSKAMHLNYCRTHGRF